MIRTTIGLSLIYALLLRYWKNLSYPKFLPTSTLTRADLKHCGKIPDARDELNRSVREGRIQSRHSIKSLEGMGSSSHDLGAAIRMHSFTVNCDTFSNEEKVAAVVPVTSVEVTCSEAMIALNFSTLLVRCLMKILGRSALG